MEQLFGAIPAVLNELGPNAEIEQAVVFAAWKRCAGGPLAERTFPREFFENRLVVAVEDDIWRRHLESLCPQIIARINESLGDGRLRFIEFRVEPKHFAEFRRQSRSVDSDPAANVPRSLADAAENIADPALRARFLDTAAEYIANQKANL
ncbi:hypothetical protein BH20ACI2_BH20ACI2_15780 [soil metagenome]